MRTRILVPGMAILLWIVCSFTTTSAQSAEWILTPSIGYVDLGPRSGGLGFNFRFDERRPVYGLTLTRAGERYDLDVSYRYVASEMRTHAYVLTPPGHGRLTEQFATADLRGHWLTGGVSLPIVLDREGGRAFVGRLGAGVAVFDPSRNHVFRTPDADLPLGPVDLTLGPVPSRLEVTVDPIVRAGIGLRLPLRQGWDLGIDFSYSLQYCGLGEEIESRYLCSMEGFIDHVVLETGLALGVFD